MLTRFENRMRFSFPAQLNSSSVSVHYRLAGLPDQWVKFSVLTTVILHLTPHFQLVQLVRLPTLIQT